MVSVTRPRGSGGPHYQAASVGFSPEWFDYMQTYPLEPGRGTLIGRTLLEGRIVHIADVLSDPEYKSAKAQELGGHRAVLGIPMLREGTAVGVFMIARRTPRPFTEKQIELGTTFADQAVIAIENVRLFEEVQARTRELQESLEYQTATSDVLNVISRAPSQLDPVFEVIVQTAARLCRAEYALVYILHDGAYRVAAANNAEEEFVQYAREHPLVAGRGSLIGRTALEGRTVHLPDCVADPEYTLLEYQRIGKYRSTLGVPLVRDGLTIGVIALMRSVVQPFTMSQIELVETFANQAVIAIENVRLFEEVQARTRELQESLEYQTATSEVLNLISRAPSQLQPVFDAIVETAARLCEAEYAIVYRLEDGNYHLAATNNADAEYLKYLRDHPIPPARGSVIGRTALEVRTVHLPDCLADPEYTAIEFQRSGGFRTVLGVPLLRNGVPVGVIGLLRNVVKPFSEKQIELAETFADQAVIAIENVRLFEEVEERTRELSESLQQQTATADVLKVISRSAFDLKAVLEALTELAARLCEADMAGIVQGREGEDEYFYVTSYNFTEEARDFMRAIPIRRNRGSIVGRALLEGAIVHVPDVLTDGEYAYGEAQRIAGYRTILGVPLLREGNPIGVIFLARKTVKCFSDNQIVLVTTFADQAVIAIENVRLFDEVHARTQELARSVSELQALGEVTHAVNSTLDLETVLNTIVAKAVQLSATDAGAIYVFSNLRQKFRLRATYGMSEKLVEEFRDQKVGLGESYLGSATQRREPIQVPDLEEEPPSDIRDLVLRAGYRALLVVPLLRPDHIVGALVVRRKAPGLFPQSTHRPPADLCGPIRARDPERAPVQRDRGEEPRAPGCKPTQVAVPREYEP